MTVSQDDFDAHLQRIPEEHRLEAVSDPQRIGAMLDNLMLPRLLAVEADRAGLLSDSLLQSQMYQAVAVLAAERFMEWYLDENRLESYESQARELFLSRPDSLRSEQRYSFTHILVRAEPVRTEVEALRRIVEIHDRLEAGEAMDDLAYELSDDPSARRNRGVFERSNPEDLDQNFAQALMLLSAGQMSDPVPTEFGWHIIRLDEIHGGDLPASFEEVREQALRMAEVRHRGQLRDRLFARLMDQELDIADGAVADLLARYRLFLNEGNGAPADAASEEAAASD
ncbi:MAG: peptidylprolyl isomerase [Wenzhouxiangella sp.]|nr:peptidylprolyl isomerase [Wenzhouxiangella sp.]MCH8478906.1 peptidylprolyl isomerase [Wenzhouxiangella sp.]